MCIAEKDPDGYGPADVVDRLNRVISSGIESQDYTFKQREKNEKLFRDYVFNSCKRKQILLSLTVDDFVRWEYSDKPEFKDCIVYFFEKTVKLMPRFVEDAQEKPVELYVKFTWNKSGQNCLVVISFHEKEY